MSFYEGDLHITLVVGSHEFFCTVIDASWTLYFLMKSSVPGYIFCMYHIYTLNTLQFHLPVMSTLGGSAIVEV